MSITLAQANTNLDLWVSASEAVAKGKSYEMDGNKLTRADVSEILRMIGFWEARVARLDSNGRIKVRRIIPLG